MNKKTAALIALILASAGGAAFLHKNPNPTLRDVFAACEKGELRGIACCENVLLASDMRFPEKDCGAVSPENHDPLGTREKLENDWDKEPTQ